MPERDSLLKDYMSNKTVFADVFNFMIYEGEQVLKPENLSTLSPETVVLQDAEDGKLIPSHRIRDLLMAATIMTDGHVAYAALGIENQTQVDAAMPARNMHYDSSYYMLQVEEMAAARRAKSEKPTKGKFSSKFRRGDLLIPTVTATLFFSPERWTGPRTLYDMFGYVDPRLKRFLPNYSANIIVPAELEERDFRKMTT